MNEKEKTIILRVLMIAAMPAVAGACVFTYPRFGKSAVGLIRGRTGLPGGFRPPVIS